MANVWKSVRPSPIPGDVIKLALGPKKADVPFDFHPLQARPLLL